MAGTRDYNGLNLDQPGRGRIYDSVLETIANTPLVRTDPSDQPRRGSQMPAPPEA